MIRFIIFITLFLLIYAGGHYIVYRLYRKIFKLNVFRIIFLFVLYFFAFSYLLSRLLSNYLPQFLQHFLNYIGTFWMVAATYLFLFSVFYYLLYMLHIIGEKYIPFDYDILKIREYYSFLSLISIAIIMIYGYRNAVNTRVNYIEIETDKMLPLPEMTLVLASDIHLGDFIGVKFSERFTEILNSLQPDLVLIPGDIIDSNLDYVVRNKLVEPMKAIESRFGVYASPGNHDFFDDFEGVKRHFEDLGFVILDDESIVVAESIKIIGRRDHSSKRFDLHRKKLLEIDSNINEYYTIVLDHQPFSLDESVENSIDLHLSGHTHNGQFWPFNIITNIMYEIAWGHLQKDDTHIYVSCGFGTWGPVFRLGSYSEIVVIKLISNYVQ